MESETTSNMETVEFTIRSAFQAFEDHKVKCSLEWTVLDMKRHLEETCPIKPEASKQRLIFSGKCLQDSQTLREILMSHQRQLSDSNSIIEEDTNEVLDLETPKVIHLVVPPTERTNTIDSNERQGLRHRRNDTTVNNSEGSNNVTNSEQNQQSEEVNPTIQEVISPTITNYDPSNPYHIYYQTYLTQLMQHQHQYAISLRQELGLTDVSPLPEFPSMNISFQSFNIPQNTNVPLDENNQNNNGGNNNERNNARNGMRADYMGMALSAIRFTMFIIIMMSYVTFERLFIVVGIITIMWFLKMHRDRRQIANNNNNGNERNLNTDNQENITEPTTDEAPQPENNEVISENQENINQENVPPQIRDEREESIVVAFWHSFTGVVTSFIYSIIPENTGNVNQ
uniref:Ubiquitin-like domain-containing protein n=1 Tax=Parastrongyloides trichosuri TaxID=131310 RepID=A0A0N4ZEW5_PARTI